MRTIAIIPARAGSKGIPGKNTMDWFGKPLVAWTIEQAWHHSSLVHDVVVTSDDEDLLKYVQDEYRGGVWAIKRPSGIAGDEAKVEDAIEHAIDEIQQTHDAYVMLNPTSPMRQSDDIDNAIRLMSERSADSVFSASKIKGFTWSVTGGESPKPVDYDPASRPRRQDCDYECTIEENGSIYVCTAELWRKTRLYLGGVVKASRMHSLDSFQLDEPEDIPLLKSLWPIRMAHASSSRTISEPLPQAV